MHRMIYAAVFAASAVLLLAGTALGQDTGPIDEPDVGLLASAAGLSGVIFIIMNVLRNLPSWTAESFDRWAAAVAIVIGILLAEAYAIFIDTGNPASIESRVVQAALVGLFAGGFSQNVNRAVMRAANQ